MVFTVVLSSEASCVDKRQGEGGERKRGIETIMMVVVDT